MPPALATFGAARDFSALNSVYQGMKDTCDKRVLDEFLGQGLHDVVAFGVSSTELLEILLDSGFLMDPASVAIWFTAVPEKQEVMNFLVSLGVTWARPPASQQLAKDQLLVSMRVGLFYKKMVAVLKARESGGADGADPSDFETPIDQFASKTLAAAFVASNDRVVEWSMLAPQNIQGAIKRQYESGVFVEVSLKMVIIFREASVRQAHQMVTDIKTGNTKVVGKSAMSDVKSIMDAVFRLLCVSYTRVFIGGTFPAAVINYPGPAMVGVVKGIRYQFCMQSHEAYCSLVMEVATILNGNLGEFLYRFSTFHKRIFQMIQTQQMSYAHGQLEAMKDMFAFMRQAQPRQAQHPSPVIAQPVVPGAEAKIVGGSGGKRSFDEISALPGFIKGIRTFGATKECPKLAALDAAKARFCQHFNTGQICSYGANCKRAHLCDILLADKSVCCAAHSRKGHVDALGLPLYQ